MAGGKVAGTGLYAGVGPVLMHYEVDADGAALIQRGSVTLPANVQYAWPHASRKFLYIVSSTSAPGSGPKGTEHSLSVYRIDQGSGALVPHGEPVRLPTRPIHMTLDGVSRHALVAFNNPSGLRVYRINDDGTAGAEVPQPGQLDCGTYAHQVRVTADNRLAILVARGNDAADGKPEDPGALKVFKYRDGILSDEVSIAPGGGYGFGPRHLDFHPTQPWVYVSLERENKLDLFTLQGDGLAASPAFRKDTLAGTANPKTRQFASAIRIHPGGRFVYVANRADTTVDSGGRQVLVGGENNLAVYAIDPVTGEPSAIQHIETRGIHCRNVHIDPTGRLLVASHIKAFVVRDGDAVRDVPACLSLFRIGADGRLAYVRKYDVELNGKLMFWMGMVER